MFSAELRLKYGERLLRRHYPKGPCLNGDLDVEEGLDCSPSPGRYESSLSSLSSWSSLEGGVGRLASAWQLYLANVGYTQLYLANVVYTHRSRIVIIRNNTVDSTTKKQCENYENNITPRAMHFTSDRLGSLNAN